MSESGGHEYAPRNCHWRQHGRAASSTGARRLFERVTIIDRDRFPAVGEQRRGVPQGRHTHALLASGRHVLEEFFPGICETLIARGGLEGDATYCSRWFVEGGCFARRPSSFRDLRVSRPLLEGTVRDRVLSLGNITAVQDRAVEGLVESGGRVTGVRLRGRPAIAANLVMDATGRGSQSPQWLEAIGYPKPKKNVWR